MTKRLLQFGVTSPRIYTFPQTQELFKDNFVAGVSNMTRLPGLDGGFDQYGSDPLPTGVGKVQSTFTLVGLPTNIEDLRDALKATKQWGLQRLYYTPAKTGANPRWCYAKVLNIDMPQQLDQHADWFQKANVEFEVSDPHWYVDGGSPPVYGDKIARWGDATSKWGGIAVTYSGLSGLHNFLTITPTGGNAPIRPRIVVTIGANTVTGPLTIEHGVDGVITESIIYSGALTPGKILEIDTRAQTFYVNGAADYSTAWSFITADIMTLTPGASVNNFNLHTGDSNITHTFDVSVNYNETYI